MRSTGACRGTPVEMAQIIAGRVVSEVCDLETGPLVAGRDTSWKWGQNRRIRSPKRQAAQGDQGFGPQRRARRQPVAES